MTKSRQLKSGVWRVTVDVTRVASRVTRSAFSLIEILIVMSLLSVIVVGLMAMFGQVQKAFLGSVTQTDVLESGRATTELLARELAGIIPSYQGGVTNFYAEINSAGTVQTLPGAGTFPRTNVLERLYFLTRENQTWTGCAYVVEDNGSGVGTLYRSLATTHVSMASANLFPDFSQPPSTSTNWHRVMDGVIQFSVRAFDAQGRWITSNLVNNAGFQKSDILYGNKVPGEVGLYVFMSNAVPAYVEFEIGILEKRTYERFKALPSGPPGNNPQEKYLLNQVGKTHLFRQRVPVRMVDVNAYQ